MPSDLASGAAHAPKAAIQYCCCSILDPPCCNTIAYCLQIFDNRDGNARSSAHKRIVPGTLAT
ncbi:hypothetical protein VD0002_g5298 [Verticillium dahliae]|uniref:Uncharacterized protein n=1 Tax=Verticillium dahliae TaxID=27337 RepID=A0AA44WS59_VERDA|nr:hypothetical protein BJF96_g715 [Verticillium dahliae]PNH45549.1 hypothetical protein VD0004_g2372 [Verticillium dahliae]PNH55925.1 hypothetical protein VD0003_g1756 [Verticillium dahliae]PNH62894.1 hypothetical protein VD0002_g5298 [Verticillium dahliae]PNH74915.1 hypothetical protein VD0001_g2606 [Verticillium dahliae]